MGTLHFAYKVTAAHTSAPISVTGVPKQSSSMYQPPNSEPLFSG